MWLDPTKTMWYNPIKLTWAGRPLVRLCKASRSWLNRSPTTSFWFIRSISVARWLLLRINALYCISKLITHEKGPFSAFNQLRMLKIWKKISFSNIWFKIILLIFWIGNRNTHTHKTQKTTLSIKIPPNQ